MRYYKCYVFTVTALVVFALYVIANLLPFQKYMRPPRPDGLFRLLNFRPGGAEADFSAAPIVADIPRSEMALGERKRRRDMALKWAQRHRLLGMGKEEDKIKKRKRPSDGHFIADANNSYKYIGPDNEKKPDYEPFFNLERKNVSDAMVGYDYLTSGTSLKDLVMEEGGQPVRALISTTWRSGSTFLGDLLMSHPATFYHYEPLMHYGIKQVREGIIAEDAIRVVKNLLHCKYDELEGYVDYGRNHPNLFSHNRRLWGYCHKGKEKFCFEREFLNRFCSLFPFQTLKTVRLRLNLTRALLEDADLNVKVLLLVRDPRGTMQSRQHRKWCPGRPDCDNAEVLCHDLVDDHAAARILARDFPDRFRAIRYEDFSEDPTSHSEELFRFFGFQMHPNVRKFLGTHTKKNVGGVSSTVRDSKTAPYHWKKDLEFAQIKDVQSKCQEAMSLWGYRAYDYEGDLQSINSVDKLKWD